MGHTIKLRVCEIITVEGNASDLAMYTCFLLDMLTSLAEEKQKKLARKDVDAIEHFLNLSLEQLMKQEKGEDEN